MKLKGKNALVTGSAKRIGKTTLLALAKEGCNVGVHYLNSEKAALETKKEAEKFKVKTAIFRADVTDSKQCKKLIDDFTKKFGAIDILINNVGNFISKPLDKFKPEEWNEMINSNLNSTYYCSKYALEKMRKQKEGNIVNISAAGADRVHSNITTTAYQIAKTGVLVLTKTLAKMEASNNIRVNAVSPGVLENSIVKPKVPMNRFGKEEEIADAILFLLSDKASFITGADLEVSGGYQV